MAARAVTVQRGGECYTLRGRTAAIVYKLARADERIRSFQIGRLRVELAGRKVVLFVEESFPPSYSDEFCDDEELPTA